MQLLVFVRLLTESLLETRIIKLIQVEFSFNIVRLNLHSGGIIMSRLENGTRFPAVTAQSAEYGKITVPSDLGSEWVTLLFYRGEW
jgi:hypothetical protein